MNQLQNKFLNRLRSQKTFVTVFLTSGVKLQGYISSFDEFTILLGRDISFQLVYKHAVSTIMPLAPVNLHDADTDTEDNII
jgi:host factor-I protein